MSWLGEQRRYGWIALGYFTRIPVPQRVGFDTQGLRGASRYFPLIGWLVGACGAAVLLLSATLLPVALAVLLSMGATLLLTGALHEDGLADCCDGFGGGFGRDEVLRIMRDSRIGAFGAIGLILVLLLKWQSLAELARVSVSGAAWTLVAAHAASRAFAISLLLTHDYVRDEGKARALAVRLSAPAAAIAAVTGLAPLFWPGWQRGALTLAVLLLLRLALGAYFKRRIGGYTGDCLGGAQQLFEVAIYLTALAWN